MATDFFLADGSDVCHMWYMWNGWCGMPISLKVVREPVCSLFDILNIFLFS